MTGLALLAHSAPAADPQFNYTFYATVATIIPVFFIAIGSPPIGGERPPAFWQPETEGIPRDPAGDPQPPSVVQAAIPADSAALGQAGHIPESVATISDGARFKVRRIKALTTASLRADAEASPDLTVLSAWAYVETAISDLARVLGISSA
jgi:hypothetical protein